MKSSQQLSSLFLQLHTLLQSGVGLVDSLDCCARTGGPELGPVFEQCSADIQQGLWLSQAMQAEPELFPPFTRAMVALGERTGALVEVIHRMAELLAQRERSRMALRRALTYPVFLLVLGTVLLLAFVTFVFPPLQELLNQLGATPPWPTRVLCALSRGLGSPIVLLGLGLGLLECLLQGSTLRRALQHRPAWKYVLDRALAWTPGLGQLVRAMALRDYTHSLALALEAGLPLPQSLDLSRGVLANQELSSLLKPVRAAVEAGEPVSECLERVAWIPAWVVGLLTCSEEVNSLPKALRYVAKACDEQLELQFMIFSSLLEPLVLVLISVLGGFLALATIGPLFSILQAL
ncbi:MAG: type II secretion system F family protein [Vulcanimicrobiota bacterium]